MSKQLYSMSTYIGETSTGLATPVFFDPHSSIQNNQPPVTLITGQPGSGKTYLGLLLAAHSAALDKTTIILDPKGDFLALKKLEKTKDLEKISVWSVFDMDSNDDSKLTVLDINYGVLNPLTITKDVNRNVSLTLDVIYKLVKNVSGTQRNAIIPIVRDEAESENPSLLKIIRKLKMNDDNDVRALALDLETPLLLPAAKILIAPPRGKVMKPDFSDGTTVISLMGMKIPSSGKAQENYSSDERLSSCIMGLLTNMVLDILNQKPKTFLKTLIIDEAWVVFGNEDGKNMLDSVSLLGRSLNMAVILLTQSPYHLKTTRDEAGIDNTISTRFAFSNRSNADNIYTCENMNISTDWHDLIKKLGLGQCLMKDCRDKLAIIHILTNERWHKAFNTKPAPKKEDNDI